MIAKEKKQAIIAEYGRTPNDTGSPGSRNPEPDAGNSGRECPSAADRRESLLGGAGTVQCGGAL